MLSSSHATTRRTSALTVALFSLAAWPAVAQQPPPAPLTSSAPTATWTVSAGYSSISLRDIARTGRPVDASPIALVGRGPAVSVRLDRGQPARLHRFDLDLSTAGSFSYDSPLGGLARSGDESCARVGGRYEYRRYPFRNLLFTGLDIGVGGRATGDRRSVNRQMSAAITMQETEWFTGIGVVAAARLRRWRRLELEAAWGNSLVLAHTSQHHSEAAVSSFSSFGGGWLTDFRLIAALRVSSRASLALAYSGDGGGLLSNHHAVASNSRQLTVGVTYER